MTKETKEQMRVRKQRWIDSLTPERRAEMAKRRIALRSARRAAKAIAEGRIPGKPGKKAFSPEVKKAANKANYNRWKNKNLTAFRKRDAELHKKRLAEKAIANGRKPGVIGREKIYTREQLAANKSRKTMLDRIKNPEKFRIRSRKYHETHKEEDRIKVRNRRARIKGAKGTHTKADIAQLWFLQKGKCGLCDVALGNEPTHVDHWVPLSKGGSNDKGNLKLLHKTCNLRKSNKLPEELGLRINIRSN